MEAVVGMSSREEGQPVTFQSVDLKFPVCPEAELGEGEGGKTCRLGGDGLTLLEEGNGPDDRILFQSQNEFIPPCQGNVGPVCQGRRFVDRAENKTVALFSKDGAEATSCHDDTAPSERLPGGRKGM